MTLLVAPSGREYVLVVDCRRGQSTVIAARPEPFTLTDIDHIKENTMDNETKKRGRPKAQSQNGPLVLEGDRAHVKVEIEMPAATADELKEYVRWVELAASEPNGISPTAQRDGRVSRRV